MSQKLKYIGFFALALVLMSNKSRQALKALEDGDFDKAIDFLEKSYERDSLNPNIAYVYSVMYSTDSFPQYNLDTAYQYIFEAIFMLDSMTDDHQKEMDRAELVVEDFYSKKREIDSLAWLEAYNLNTISGFIDFSEKYHDSKFVKEAIIQRMKLEFEVVEEENTWQAYQKFIREFPEAREVAVAKVRFDRLVYEDKTKSNQREDLEDFLIEFPTTPYREQIERRIFDLIWADLDFGEYYVFINAHHNPRLTNRAFGILYHFGELKEKKLKGFNVPQYKEFMDSVTQLETLNSPPLIPIYDDKKYQWIDLSGRRFLDTKFDHVSDDYLCGNVQNELLEVRIHNESRLINRQGTAVLEGFIGKYEELGDGIIKIMKNEKFGAIHSLGFSLMPYEYDDIKWLGSSLFAGKKGDRYALYNFGGSILTQEIYDDIFMLGDFWIFEKDELFAVSSLEHIKSMVAEGGFEVEFEYEEFEIIGDKYLIAFEENYEVLYDRQLNVLTPENTERINTRYDHWVFKNYEGYRIYESEKNSNESLVYDQVLQNDEWLGLRREEKWEVRSKNINSDAIVAIDSLKLLGDDIAIVFRLNSGMAIFPNKEIVYINNDDYLTSISDPSITDSHYLVVKRGKENVVYKDGKEQFRTEYDEIDFITEKGFLVKEGTKYGAVNERGHLIMRVRYDAIGEPENGVASVLYNGKFGGFNFDDKILVSLTFEEKMVPYNENLLVMKSEGQYGLISRKNVVVVEPEFEEIKYWTDSSFLTKEDGSWLILNIESQTEELSGFHDFEYLKNTNDEKIILIYSKEGTGVFHSAFGLIIPPVYTDIINLGNQNDQLYFAEKTFEEAEYHIVVYYDKQGKKVRTAAYSDDEIDFILCDQ